MHAHKFMRSLNRFPRTLRSAPVTQCRHHSKLQAESRSVSRVCSIHFHNKLQSLTIQNAIIQRSFSASVPAAKKGGKAAREEKANAGGSSGDDPFDFKALEDDIASVVERLKSDLSKLRAGGRFNPEIVENLRVQLDKKSATTVKLSDIAQIVPKGRQLQVLVGESEHLKPVTSALMSSTLSLTPQPDPTGSNPLLLLLPIPPPTAESRMQVVGEATKAGEKAATQLRDARGKQQKKLRAIQLARSARPDDLKKAATMMEKVVERGSGELKKIVESAKKVLESG